MTSTKEATQRPPRKLVHLPTVEAYDRWASVYDSDGNILQALDSHALTNTMFTRALASLPKRAGDQDALYITDLGCGTGRATLLLLSTLRARDHTLAQTVAEQGYGTIYLSGLDASLGMLKVADQRVPAFASVGDKIVVNTKMWQWNMLDSSARFKPLGEVSDAAESKNDAPESAHAIISTLVLEHIPLELYFKQAKRLLRPGGVFLVTNMHNEMGNKAFGAETGDLNKGGNEVHSEGGNTEIGAKRPATAAGFIDETTNTKIRGDSYAHTVEEVLDAARRNGFNLVGEQAEELCVEPWMFEQGSSRGIARQGTDVLLGPRGRKWLGTKCWYGMIFKLDL